MKLIYLHLLQAFRSMQRNYLQTLLSAIGLVVGLSSFVFAFNWLRYEMTYDSFRPDSENIYAVCNHNQNSDWYNYSQPYPMYALLRDSIPGVTDAAIMGNAQIDYLADASRQNLVGTFSGFYFVNPGFLKMMGIKLLSGDPETALNRMDGVVITQRMARAVFQREDVLGETLSAKRYADETVPQILTITGVAEDCYEHTSIPFDMLTSMANFSQDWWSNWNNYSPRVFFKASDASDIDKRLRIRLVEGKSIFFATPLSHMPYTRGMWAALTYPTIAMAISLLLLLSALFNYMAILTAQFVARFREYKLRINLGGSLARNMLWLYSEVFIMSMLLFLGTGVLLEIISAWSDMPNINRTTLLQSFAILFPIVLLLLFLIALYPTICLRNIYHRSLSGKTQIKITNSNMVFVQVLVCALLTFIFINAYRQFHFMTHTHLGFNYERVIRIFTRDSPFTPHLVESMLQELRTNQGGGPIEDVVASPSSIFQSRQYQGANLSWAEGEDVMESKAIKAPAKIFHFFGIRPVSGKIYDRKEEGGIPQIMLNRDAADLIHYSDKASTCLLDNNNPIEIVGIVDFYARNFKEGAFPVVYYYTEENAGQYGYEVTFIRYKEGQYAEALHLIHEMLRKRDISPESVEISEMDRYIAQFYWEEAYFLRLISLIFIASILITLLGVLSQISYTLRMHRKFIAVRCVFGASYLDLCHRYLREYVLLSVVACFVSLPVGYYLISQWLLGYRASVSVGLFECLWIGVILLALIGLVVIIRLSQALNENPAEVIKSE